MDIVEIDYKALLEAFRLYPGYIISGAVIYLLYRLLVKKDEIIRSLLESNTEEVEQRSKITTLLEILVNRKE